MGPDQSIWQRPPSESRIASVRVHSQPWCCTNHAQLTSDAHAPCLLDRRVRLIRRFIDDRALRLLVHAFITSRLDYCNGLCELHCGCLSTNTANSEQCCSFSLFRTSLQPRCTAAIPITLAAGCQLHNIQTVVYFDVWCRTRYSPCVLKWALCSLQWPSSVIINPRRFAARRTRTHFADSLFVVARPAAWKSLPSYIRNIDSHSAFCHHLKTYLFTALNRLNCDIHFLFNHFYRATQLISYGNRNYVRLSYSCFVTKSNNALRIFWYHTKVQSL